LARTHHGRTEDTVVLTTVVWLHRGVAISDWAITAARSKVAHHAETRLRLETFVFDTPLAVSALARSLAVGNCPPIAINIKFAGTRFALHLSRIFIFTRVTENHVISTKMKRTHIEDQSLVDHNQKVEIPSEIWLRLLRDVVQGTEIKIYCYFADAGRPPPKEKKGVLPQWRQVTFLHLVCRAWHAWMGDALKQLSSLSWATMIWTVQHCDEYQHQGPVDLLALFPSVQYMDISPQWTQTRMASRVCCQYLQRLSNLTALNLKLSRDDHADVHHPPFHLLTNLKSLSLRGNTMTTLAHILSIKTQLTELDVSGCGPQLDLFFINEFTALQTLSVMNCRHVDVDRLRGLSSLKRLDLRGISWSAQSASYPFSAVDYRFLCDMTGLEELTLTRYDMARTIDPSAVRRVEAIKDLRVLEHCRPYPFPRDSFCREL
jgi:hypothetical protein